MFDFDFLPIEYKLVFAIALIVFVVALFFFMYFFHYISQGKEILNVNPNQLFCDVSYFYEIGKRPYQEDSFYISPLEDNSKNGIVLCVSDGMGGLSYGDVISKKVVDTIESWVPMSFFASEKNSDSIRSLSRSIYEEYHQSGGATLAMVHIVNNYLNYYSVGDSNIILVRNGIASVLNQKQNYLRYLIKTLVKQGRQTGEAYADSNARALTDFIGNSNTNVNYSIKPIRILDDDTIIVCSDGVTDSVSSKRIAALIEKSARATAFNIKQSVKSKKSPKQDNYTAIVVRVKRSPL